MKFKVSDKPIHELVHKFDIAYTSCFTTAALDAYGAGLKIISVLDPTTLNLSPLKRCSICKFRRRLWRLLAASVNIKGNYKRVNIFTLTLHCGAGGNYFQAIKFMDLHEHE